MCATSAGVPESECWLEERQAVRGPGPFDQSDQHLLDQGALGADVAAARACWGFDLDQMKILGRLECTDEAYDEWLLHATEESER